MTRIRPFRPNYGDGSDGAIHITSNTNWSSLSATRELNCTTFELDAGVTLTLDGTHKVYIVRARTSAKIYGMINGVGAGWDGGAGVTSTWVSGNDGTGPRKGRRGRREGDGGLAEGGRGGGGPHNHAGDMLVGTFGTYNAGSGGGSGGNEDGSGGATGKGGDGGACLVVITPDLETGANTDIDLSGQNGSNPTVTGGSAAGGGGGEGGDFLGIAERITTPASGTVITSKGGLKGEGNTAYHRDATDGQDGKICLAYIQTITADAASRCNPAATVIDLKRLPILLG